jgi:diguanylate cyclase (GGDEF)-like protein
MSDVGGTTYDRVREEPWGTHGEHHGVTRAIEALRGWLPKGQLLPEHIWRRRHATIVWLLWAHVPALFIFGLAMGNSPEHMIFEASLLIGPAGLASLERVGVKFRVAAASLGLASCSAMLVHLSGGYIEAHFHFFVMIGVLTLYQDWMPFLLAIVYVVGHHTAVGLTSPENVYNHPDAIDHPLKWALIHGGFVLAASAAHVVAWRTNENQLLRDPLTGLPSRLLFINRLTGALERLQRRRGRYVAVLFLDLDRFKVINDSLGHTAGDKLILAVAERLRHSLRRHEMVARFGGDEFAILCEDIIDEQDAVAVAERVLRTFGLPFDLSHGETMSAASLGIALTADPDQDVEDLIRDADAAMYRAKESGGGRLMLFDEVTRQRALTRLHTERALRRAIDEEQFRVYFQPEVSVETGAIVGLEALVRWEHPERGLLLPDEFISLAEETGLIIPIGTWVLRESCRRATAWQAERVADEPLVVRVNVSARQLGQEDLPKLVSDVIDETGMKPEHLCLEVTESVLVEDPESSIKTLASLRRLGVKIAVDDFGTGYSSLEYLRRFPVDCVKIDRSFVRGLPHSSEDVAIVNAVIELGHALSLSVTAEGVETSEQLGNLQSAGCDTAQGFLFSRPQHPDVVERLLLDPEAATLEQLAADESSAA